MKFTPALLLFALVLFTGISHGEEASSEGSGGDAPAVSATVEAGEGEEELSSFGSGEPVEREDMPERGKIEVPGGGKMEAMGHWDQYDWKVTTPRWGRYEVQLTYGLKMNSLGVQLKLGEERLKMRLPAARFDDPNTVSLGTLYFPEAGEHALSLYTPPVDRLKGIEFKGLRLIPAPEGEEVVQEEDGSVQMLAKDARTWSTNMRYEPKPEKNCLGYWTEAEDIAEWEFTVEKVGTYEVKVFQGCGGGNGGSEVEVQLGDQSLTFSVVDTGGFQEFKPVEVGQLEIAKPGHYRLALKPKNKAKGAIMDVQKVVLTPVAR